MSDFKAKMHKIRFPLGLRPRPHWRSLQRSPSPLTVFEGPTFKGREREEGGKGKGRRRKEEGKGEGEGREEEGPAPPPQYFGLEPRLDDGLTR